MNFPHKNIRLSPAKYKGDKWHFVTMCCAGRRRAFADDERARWMLDALRREASLHGFAIHAYCVMPDHLHALVMGLDTQSDLLAFMKNVKQKTAYEFQGAFGRSLWQKKFYDHILRENESVSRVAAYIWMNPVRKGICREAREYPHSGSFVIDWRKEAAPTAEMWTPPWRSEKEKAKPPA